MNKALEILQGRRNKLIETIEDLENDLLRTSVANRTSCPVCYKLVKSRGHYSTRQHVENLERFEARLENLKDQKEELEEEIERVKILIKEKNY